VGRVVVPVGEWMLGREGFKEFGMLIKRFARGIKRELVSLSHAAPANQWLKQVEMVLPPGPEKRQKLVDFTT
jgi:hypothetical protein